MDNGYSLKRTGTIKENCKKDHLFEPKWCQINKVKFQTRGSRIKICKYINTHTHTHVHTPVQVDLPVRRDETDGSTRVPSSLLVDIQV